MKKSLYLISILSVIFLTGCGTTAITQDMPLDTTGTPQYALVSFFDALSTGQFENAVEFFDFEGHGEWVYSSSDDPAQILEDYCAATGTCLRAEVLATNEVNGDEYTLTVQFFNSDGSIYIAGPCCGATEEEMPSQDTFEFTVKKIDGVFKVTTAPLYRP
jgi:hypothetical protein